MHKYECINNSLNPELQTFKNKNEFKSLMSISIILL